jgi:hypothetical protein
MQTRRETRSLSPQDVWASESPVRNSSAEIVPESSDISALKAKGLDECRDLYEYSASQQFHYEIDKVENQVICRELAFDFVLGYPFPISEHA